MQKRKKRNILLIEPNYKNKYPPIGLMKLSTYHKDMGDKVEFFKGDLNDFLLSIKIKKCISHLKRIENKIGWEKQEEFIRKYLRTRHLQYKDSILKKIKLKFIREKVDQTLQFYAKYYFPKN